MSRSLILTFILFAVMFPCFSDSQVRLTGNVALDFVDRPSLKAVIDAFSERQQDIVWGFGWEVIFHRMGIGGDYFVNFFQGQKEEWWFDWVSQSLYLSYHFFGGGAFIDPFFEVGVGCAGRSAMEEDVPKGKDQLYLSLYPQVGAGLALDFSGFLTGIKLAYIPTVSPPPGTHYQNFPLDNFLVTVFAGAALGGHR